MTTLLDEAAAAFGGFDADNPRDHAVWGLCLQFWEPLFAARQAEISRVIAALARLARSDSALPLDAPRQLDVGLQFWLPQPEGSASPRAALALLASLGLGLEQQWDERRLTERPNEPHQSWFYSQRMRLSSSAIEALSELVLRFDHGGWRGIGAAVSLWLPPRGPLLRFWDDRGADVLFADESAVRQQRGEFDAFVDPDLTAQVWPRTLGH